MKRNAALVVAFLCLAAFFMPWDMVVPDPFYIHVLSMTASSILVIVAARLNRTATWSTVVQVVESACTAWQATIILNWDNPNDVFYLIHDEFMMCAFVIEMLFLIPQIPIIAGFKDALSNSFRRAFLFVVRAYPNQSNLHS